MKKIAFVVFFSALMVCACDDVSDDDNTQDNAKTATTKPKTKCTDDTFKCNGNKLYKCVSEKWKIKQTCEENTQCNADKGSCDPLDNTHEENTQCNEESGSCESNDETKCTDGAFKCDGKSLSKCVAGNWEISQTCEEDSQCDEETGSCSETENSVVGCKDTEHLYADDCEADDVTHCGTHTNDCTQISGWKTGSCMGKECVVEECQIGYHLGSLADNEDKPICEEDTHDACGPDTITCGPDEICTEGNCKDTCKTGQAICKGSCINPNTSANFCGADPSCTSFIACSEFETCTNGKCILTFCQNEEDTLCTGTEQNVCINIHGNNPNHCGACNDPCLDTETAKVAGCSQGKCLYACNEDRVNCGSDTEPMCLPKDQLKSDASHCGKCDKQCESNEYCRDGQCIINSCTGNECLYNEACVNLNDHCGTQCLNCNTANHASSGICQGGSCTITACVARYHLTSNGVCEVDSDTACPNGNTTETVNCNTLDQNTKTWRCVNAQCQATECLDNFHLKENRCVADTLEACGSETNDCTQLAGWKEGRCEQRKCVATSCQNNFCLNTLQGQCTNVQSSSTCGINGNACQSCTIKQVCSTGTCVKAVCNDNVCQQATSDDQPDLCQNDNTHCGSNCLNCNAFTTNATAGTCNTSNGTCQLTDCETGYHIHNNACEADSLMNCGAHDKQCHVDNATNTCSEGLCRFSCNTGLHEYNKACEADDLDNCGKHGTPCLPVENATSVCSDGTCDFVCNDGYIKEDGNCVKAFISTWFTGRESFVFPIGGIPQGKYIIIYWGDGTNTKVNSSGLAKTILHNYDKYGTYTIAVTGKMDFICVVGNSLLMQSSHLIEIEFYGDISFGEYTFNDCSIQKLPTQGNPPFPSLQYNYTFKGAPRFNQNINFWDTSKIVSMISTFENATSFNQPLNDWDVSNVKDMRSMFKGATSFNQPLNDWDVSNVGYETGLGSMESMFQGATSFNQPLDKWNVSNVFAMGAMFQDATSFDQPLNDWDVSRVYSMSFMFQGATSFNQPLNNWNVSNVKSMSFMFQGATSFNQPLINWNVSNVKSMESMFQGATSFDQPLNAWNIANVEKMDNIFKDSGLSKENYCKLFTGYYAYHWNKFKNKLGIYYECP